MTMKIGYLEVVEVKKIRSRNVCQLIVEADISQFKNLVGLDETKGVFIPCDIEGAMCGAMDMDIEPKEIEDLMGVAAKPSLPPPDKPEPEKRGKSVAQKLMINGYFRNRKLWDAMDGVAYEQKAHYEYVKSLQPIVLYPGVPSAGDTVAHHVRTSENSGTGIKPPDWFCIPLASSQHDHLHSHQDRGMKNSLLEKAVAITEGQMKKKYKEYFKIDTLSGITKETVLANEEALGFQSGFIHQ